MSKKANFRQRQSADLGSSPWLTLEEVAERLSMVPKGVIRRVEAGSFPKPERDPEGRHRWPLEVIEAFERNPTALPQPKPANGEISRGEPPAMQNGFRSKGLPPSQS